MVRAKDDCSQIQTSNFAGAEASEYLETKNKKKMKEKRRHVKHGFDVCIYIGHKCNLLTYQFDDRLLFG